MELQEAIERRNTDMQLIANRIGCEIYNRGWQRHMTEGLRELNQTLTHPLSMTTRQGVEVTFKVGFVFSDAVHMTLPQDVNADNISHDELIEYAYEGDWAETFHDDPTIGTIHEIISVAISD